MIEFGLHSPVGVVCDGGDKVQLHQLVSNEDYDLLMSFFYNTLDDSSKFNRTIGSMEQVTIKDKLEKLDKYLDIPYIQGYFNPRSYEAFHRLVINGCTKFPPFEEGLPFCEEAAKQNHVATLQKAHEMGYRWNEQVTNYAIQNINTEMLHYIIQNNGILPNTLCIYNEKEEGYLEVVKLLLKASPSIIIHFTCVINAIFQNDIEMLTLFIHHKHFSKGWTVMDYGKYINSVQVLNFVDMFCKHKTLNNCYEEVISNAAKTNNIPLLKRALELSPGFSDNNIFASVTHLEVIDFLLSQDGFLTEVSWNEFLVIFASNKDIFSMIMKYKYYDKEHDRVTIVPSSIEQPSSSSSIEQPSSSSSIEQPSSSSSIEQPSSSSSIEQPSSSSSIELRSNTSSIETTDGSYSKAKIYDDTWACLAIHGHLELFQDYSPELDRIMLFNAIRENQFDLVKYLVERKCPWPIRFSDINGRRRNRINDYELCNDIASECNRLSILRYIHEQGFPCNGSCYRYYHSTLVPFCKPRLHS